MQSDNVFNVLILIIELFVVVDRSRVGEANVPQGYVIQCIINTTLDFDVIATKE